MAVGGGEGKPRVILSIPLHGSCPGPEPGQIVVLLHHLQGVLYTEKREKTLNELGKQIE